MKDVTKRRMAVGLVVVSLGVRWWADRLKGPITSEAKRRAIETTGRLKSPPM